MPKLGDVNNPTGIGGKNTLFKAGNQTWKNRPMLRARHLILEELGKAALAEDGAKITQICTSIVDNAVQGDEWSRQFLFDRLCGKAPQSVTFKDDEGETVKVDAERFVETLNGMVARKISEIN